MRSRLRSAAKISTFFTHYCSTPENGKIFRKNHGFHEFSTKSTGLIGITNRKRNIT
jgi:hypothetical protein